MSSRLSSLRMRLQAAALLAVLVPAIGFAAQANAAGAAANPPLISGTNYTIPANVSGETVAIIALLGATGSQQLNQIAAAVAIANANDPTVLQSAVAAAFSNPNAVGDTGGLAQSFLAGFVQGTSVNALDNPSTSALGSALLSANVPATTILSDLVTATGASLGTLGSGSGFCGALAALLNGPGAATFQTAAGSMNPNPLTICFPPPQGS